jgi:hypothetical protein
MSHSWRLLRTESVERWWGALPSRDDANLELGLCFLMTDFMNAMSQCQNITAGATYLFGFRFRGQVPNQGNSGYCDLSFYPGLDCAGDAIFVDDAVPAQVASQGVTWSEATGSATAPGNVASARMTCIAAIGFGNYDQLYLSRTTVGF